MAGPLDDLVILDLTRAVAGPFCTMNLGDLGARVIKIEEPGTGDETRNWGPPFVEGISTYFLGVNRNKRSVVADLKEDRGRQRVHRLARRADVVIENFRPGVADRLGVGYDDLARDNPQLIYLSISGFGSDGPDRERPGYDLIVQAMSGLMRVSAAPGEPPVKVGMPLADMFAGLYASQAILTALHRRSREGKGSRIEIALFECLLAAMAPVTSAYLNTGREPQPMGRSQSNICPYQIFECSDGYLAAGAPNERLWRRFAETLGHPEWIDDSDFCDNSTRVTNRHRLVPMVEAVMRERPVGHWLQCFERSGVPCGPVSSVGEALNSPQLAVRGTIVELPHPVLGTMRTIANPIRFNDITLEYVAPPELGTEPDSNSVE